MTEAEWTERDSAELHRLFGAIRGICKSVGAWGFRLEVVADGRLRADLFDGSGYSMTGENHGDVHEENSKPLSLVDMAKLARERVDRKRPGPCKRCYADGFDRCMCDPEGS